MCYFAKRTRTFQEMFNNEKHPKNVAEGVIQGLGSVGKGVFAGVAGAIISPVVGARNEGGVGFAKGAIIGLAGLVVLPVAGLFQGAMKVGEGIHATSEDVSLLLH